MVPVRAETANARYVVVEENDPRVDAAARLPKPRERHQSRNGWLLWSVRAMVALAIFGAVFPADLYLANALLGDPIHRLRDPMIVNASITFSVAFAVPVLPLALLATALHFWHVGRGADSAA